LARIEQVPRPTKVTTVPATLQTLGVWLENETGNPELAVADRDSEPLLRSCDETALTLIVCGVPVV
jgi:hypothetical protein